MTNIYPNSEGSQRMSIEALKLVVEANRLEFHSNFFTEPENFEMNTQDLIDLLPYFFQKLGNNHLGQQATYQYITSILRLLKVDLLNAGEGEVEITFHDQGTISRNAENNYDLIYNILLLVHRCSYGVQSIHLSNESPDSKTSGVSEAYYLEVLKGAKTSGSTLSYPQFCEEALGYKK